MKRINSLSDLLIEELSGLLNGENQLAEVLPKMAQASQSLTLKLILEAHQEITTSHISRLQDIFSNIGQNPYKATPKTIKQFSGEAEGVINQTEKGQARDAAIINALKSMEHYEILGYQTACEHAVELNHTGMVELLHKTLDEERSMHLHLNELAQGMINAQATENKRGGFYIPEGRFGKGGITKKPKNTDVSRFTGDGKTGEADERSTP